MVGRVKLLINLIQKKQIKIFRSLVLFTALSGVVVLNSCSKKSTPAPVAVNSITANVDGVATTFNVNAKAVTATSNGLTITTLSGTSSGGASFAIIIGSSLVAGKTYSDNAASDSDKPVIAYVVGADDYINDDDVAASAPSVTITAVSATSVQGTFTGNVNTIVIGNTPAKIKTLTSGKFNLSF